MGKDEKSFETPFAAAVNAIIDSHKKLYDILLSVFGIYNAGAIPPRHNRISRILDCEANGAHTILENLASAAKAAPRGSLGAQPDLLIAECREQKGIELFVVLDNGADRRGKSIVFHDPKKILSC